MVALCHLVPSVSMEMEIFSMKRWTLLRGEPKQLIAALVLSLALALGAFGGALYVVSSQSVAPDGTRVTQVAPDGTRVTLVSPAGDRDD